MRTLTRTALIFSYLFLAMTVGALIWRGGLGAGAGIAATFGALGVLGVIHLYLTSHLRERTLKAEIAQVRDAHRLLADALETTQGALTELAQAIESGALNRTDELTGEVRMLEGLIQQMSASIDERLSTPAPVAADTFEGRRQAQSHALLRTVHDALTAGRVDLYLQPVVTLPQRRTVFYESFTRLRDSTDRVMMPAEYLSVAEGEGLVPAIDNLLLFRCAQIVRRLARQDRKVGVFCNVALSSLGDETFFPQFLHFLSENRDLNQSLIFELGQATFDARGAVEARNMAKLADLGFRFSIDKVQTLDLDFADLQRSIMEILMQLPPETVVRPGHTEPSSIAQEWEQNPFVRAWRGLDQVATQACQVRGEPAELLLRAPDYDGGTKCWVRFAGGDEAVVGGSQVR